MDVGGSTKVKNLMVFLWYDFSYMREIKCCSKEEIDGMEKRFNEGYNIFGLFDGEKLVQSIIINKENILCINAELISNLNSV